MAKIKLVIFDFDGTLVDSAPDLVRATNIFLQSRGLKALPEKVIREEIGMGLKRLILDLYPHEKNEELERQIADEFTQVYEQEYLKTPQLFDGGQEFLYNWKGHRAIVSNKRRRFIDPILKKLNIADGWAAIIGGDTYLTMKPEPEPFLGAIEAAKVRLDETLIVGDGLPDIKGAVRLACPCVAAEFGYTPIQQLMDLGATFKIKSFHELLPLIERIT